MAARLSSITGAKTDQQACAIFLDRDGVINQNRSDYVRRVDEFIFLPNALHALRRLAETDWKVIIITNQSGVGRGLISEKTLEAIHDYMISTIEAHGGRVDKVIACLHSPDENCDCRKPKAGMLFEAAELFGLNLKASYLIGDAQSDVEAALAAGCSPIQVATGRGRQQRELMSRSLKSQSAYVEDLAAALDMIGIKEIGSVEENRSE